MATIATVVLATQLLTAASASLLTASAASDGSRPTLILSPYEIPEGLEVGSTVSYDPSGTYTWDADYYASDTATYSDIELDSSTNDYNLNEWKVLNIDQTTGKVELVPTTQTTGTVTLQGAQGYNNAVKLLNEACNALYGNSSKGITARSLNVKDIEDKMTKTAKETIKNYTTLGTKYNTQTSNTYERNCRNYPSLYEKENLSVLNGNLNSNGIGLHDQQDFIKATDNGATNGVKEAISYLQPYQTYWFQPYTFMETAFENYGVEDSYYGLLLPKGRSTTYWLASRSIDCASDEVKFKVNFIEGGSGYGTDMYLSTNTHGNTSIGMFPVVQVDIEQLNKDTAGFIIK